MAKSRRTRSAASEPAKDVVTTSDGVAALAARFADADFLAVDTAVSYTHLTLPTNREV